MTVTPDALTVARGAADSPEERMQGVALVYVRLLANVAPRPVTASRLAREMVTGGSAPN